MEITEKELRRIVRTEVRKALQEVFPIRVLDLTDSDKREIWDRVASTIPVHAAVMPVQMFDNTDGKVKNFGTWAQPQTYQALTTHEGGIQLGLNRRITFDDDLDGYLYASANNVIRVVTGGNILISFWEGSISLHYGVACDGNWLTDVGQLRLREVASTPSVVANTAQVYCKDVGGVSHLFAQRDNAAEVDLTP